MKKKVGFGIVTLMTVARFALAWVVWRSLQSGAYAEGTIVFAVAALLDFDGSLARYWQVTTKFGAFLDPLADKVLVVATVVGFLLSPAVATMSWWQQMLLVPPTLIMVVRESCTLVLPVIELIHGTKAGTVRTREYFAFGVGACHETRPPVTAMSKWKTVVQCLSLTLLIGSFALESYLSVFFFAAGVIAYWVAGYFTLVTGLDYLRKRFPQHATPINKFLRWCWIPASL